MTLDALQSFTWQTITAGGPNGDIKIIAGDDTGLDGLDLPEFRTTLTGRQGAGSHPGAQYAGDMQPACRVLVTDTPTLMVLRASMRPRPNPFDEQPWTFRGFGFPTDTTDWRLYVRPELCEFRANLLATAGGAWMVDLAWNATDPTIYSDTLHVYDSTVAGIPASGFAVNCTNTGSAPSPLHTGRALRVLITAATTCTSPKILNYDTGEYVVWPGLQIGAGQTFAWETDRTSWIGTQRVDGHRTPGTAQPILYPGDNNIHVDTATGTFDVRIEWRDTH